MREGQIKKWYSTGYGFIRTDDGYSVFAHITDVSPAGIRPLRKDRVRFEIRDTDRGPRAYNIEILDVGYEPAA